MVLLRSKKPKMTPLEVKTNLLTQCTLWLDGRYKRIQKTLEDLQISLLEESKSSAGDKHETGRAMLQIEREKAGYQLKEIEQVQQLLSRVNISTSSEVIHLGSLVYTSQANYFISISAGKMELNNQNYFCIASNTPIGQLLIGKNAADVIVFNNQEIVIETIA